MRKIIHKVDYDKKIFWIKESRKLACYQLSNRMSKTYLPMLMKGLLIDFEIHATSKHKRRQKVSHITQIVTLEPYQIIHDIDSLRTDMLGVIKQINYFAYLDFEMSMPAFSKRGLHQAEIIQFGVIITNEHHEVLEKKAGYVFKKRHGLLSDRTLKFLKIQQEIYLEQAVSYDAFYQIMKDIQLKYQPKWIVWGKNDIQVLKDSFTIHEKEAYVSHDDFMDLLKLHKDYYSLKDDLGLLKAYHMYYDSSISQTHDALDDAAMTAGIMKAFIETMKVHKKSRPRKVDMFL